MSIIHYPLSITLAIDTSGSNAVVALAESDGSLLGSTVFEGRRTLSQKLIGVIDALLAQHGQTLRTLSCLAVGVGPGSFTGLRVGLTTVKTLAQVTGKPVVGIHTLEAYALGMPTDYAVAVTPSRRNEVYACVYVPTASASHLQPPTPSETAVADQAPDPTEIRTELLNLAPDGIVIGAPFAASSEHVADVCHRLATSGTVTLCGEPQSVRGITGPFNKVEQESVPALSLAALAAARIREGRFDDPVTLLPLYVVPPAISTPRDLSVLPRA